jgi:hypothetical protein
VAARSMPFARPHLDEILDFGIAKGYPARDEA